MNKSGGIWRMTDTRRRKGSCSLRENFPQPAGEERGRTHSCEDAGLTEQRSTGPHATALLLLGGLSN